MKFIEAFLSAFWPAFIGSLVGWSLAWLAKRAASDTVLPFLGPKSFKELSSFPEREQRRLLHDAIKKAFGHWRWLIEFLVFPLTFSFAAVLGSTLVKVTIIAGASWISACGAGALAGLAFCLASRLVVQYLKPFLKTQIGRTQHASSPVS